MSDFVWHDGDPPRISRGERQSVWGAIAETMRKNPGRWAKRTYANPKTAGAAARYVRKYIGLEAVARGKDVYFRVPPDEREKS